MTIAGASLGDCEIAPSILLIDVWALRNNIAETIHISFLGNNFSHVWELISKQVIEVI